MPSLTRVPRSARTPPEDRRAEFERRVLHAVEELLSQGTPFTELAVQRIAAASGRRGLPSTGISRTRAVC